MIKYKMDFLPLTNYLIQKLFYTARRQVLCISTPLNDLDLTKSRIIATLTISYNFK
jgi:hypothetical protein